MQMIQKDLDEVFKIIEQEEIRQKEQINLIASENIVSENVRRAVGSVLSNKYSEGNIGNRYYQGNSNIDKIEKLAIDRALDLFKAPYDWDANVQAISGSYANLAVLNALLEPGDTILSMYLPDGGHLSHGWSYGNDNDSTTIYKPQKKKVHIVSKLYNVIQYKVDPNTKLINYDLLQKIAEKTKPKIIITGGTSYPRNIDYVRMSEISKSANSLYFADVAHEAGLIAAGVLPSPIGIADIVTFTTHKTLRAARGAIIMSSKDVIQKVNKSVLPGLQGGPFNHQIAGIAVGLSEAMTPEFVKYCEQIIKNTNALGKTLMEEGIDLITNGSDKHFVLVDLTKFNLNGKDVARALEMKGIIVNMNTIPGDTRPPFSPSGLRIGTPFVTSQGMIEKDMHEISRKIAKIVKEL